MNSEYVVQTSTKLVRNHNSTTVAKGKVAQVSNSTMIWTRDQAITEQITTPIILDSTVFMRLKIIDLFQVILMLMNQKLSYSYRSPYLHLTMNPLMALQIVNIMLTLFSGSPNRVVVVCDEPVAPKTVPSRTIRPKHPVYNKSNMSLRVINGQRITGDCKECYSFLTNSCKVRNFTIF